MSDIQENEIRVAALGAIYEVIGNKDFTVTFEDSYVELILKFLDSPRRNEVKVAFKIASELAQQLNCNTDVIPISFYENCYFIFV